MPTELSRKQLFEIKLATCRTCPHFNRWVGTCGTPVIGDVVWTDSGELRQLCGCVMRVKLSMFPHSVCPINRFGAQA